MTDGLFQPIKWYRQQARLPNYKTWLKQEFLPQLISMGKTYKALRFHNAENIEKQLQKPPPNGSLAGVPLAHKEIIRRHGTPDEAGSKSRKGMLAKETAFVLQRLDKTGALDCGQLVTVEYALGITGHNEYAGTPPNPWHKDYISGGSSSGSAVMVANGCLPAALGSDTGGSIRIPAAACGLVGFKPGFGTVSRSGVFSLSPSFDTVGPLARSVEDAALIYHAIKAYDPKDKGSLRRQSEPYDYKAQELRLAIGRKPFFENCDSDIMKIIEDILKHLKKTNNLREINLPDCVKADNATMMIIAYEAAKQHHHVLSKEILPLMNKQTALRLAIGVMTEETEYRHALDFRVSFTRTVLRALADIDLLIVPALSSAVPTIKATDSGGGKQAHGMIADLGRNMRIFNFLGFPALVLPIGKDKQGLPVSLQLIAKPFEEAKLFTLGQAIEKTVNWSQNTKA